MDITTSAFRETRKSKHAASQLRGAHRPCSPTSSHGSSYSPPERCRRLGCPRPRKSDAGTAPGPSSEMNRNEPGPEGGGEPRLVWKRARSAPFQAGGRHAALPSVQLLPAFAGLATHPRRGDSQAAASITKLPWARREIDEREVTSCCSQNRANPRTDALGESAYSVCQPRTTSGPGSRVLLSAPRSHRPRRTAGPAPAGRRSKNAPGRTSLPGDGSAAGPCAGRSWR